MDINEARKILKRDPEFKREYEKKSLAFEIAKIVVEARIFKRMTQAKLAKLVGTRQPSIARVERGESLPSLSFLQKIAEALNARLNPPYFEFRIRTVKISEDSTRMTAKGTKTAEFLSQGNIAYRRDSLYTSDRIFVLGGI